MLITFSLTNYYVQECYISSAPIALCKMNGTPVNSSKGLSLTAAVAIGFLRRRRPPPPPKGHGDEKPVPAAPSLSIHAPRERSVFCQICLGRIKVGQGFVVCPCGMGFHRPCVERTGYCPYCDQEYSRKAFRRRYNLPDDAKVTLRRCPVCGDFIPREATVCDCGAVFLDKDGSFSCPSCGQRVEGDMDRCPACEERFREYHAAHCPRCRSLAPDGETVCDCGTLLGDDCPDCGCSLGKHEELCPICGLMFEFVRD